MWPHHETPLAVKNHSRDVAIKEACTNSILTQPLDKSVRGEAGSCARARLIALIFLIPLPFCFIGLFVLYPFLPLCNN